jgi:predicted NBD/HSP70 family sugar kinase
MPVATPPPDAPVRQSSLRQHNLGLVLRQVATTPVPVSRADVAAATGLTRSTVSILVDELLGGGLLAELGPPPRAGAGRPAIGLRLSDRGPVGLGLEVNVDYVAACLVDLTGAVRQHLLEPADQRGRAPEAVLDDLAALAATAVRQAGHEGLTVAGVAVAVAGLVSDGIVRLAPNLGWSEVDVRSTLARRAPLARLMKSTVDSIAVDNEANLAAQAELHAWPARGARPNFLYVSGEIGVGAGIVLDGRLHRGGRGFAGELGHVAIDPAGPRCHCGATGCLEVYANQEAILRAAGLRPGPRALARLVAQAKAGTARALAALEFAGTRLGVAAAGVVNLLDLETVVLGGAYAPLAPWLAPAVSRELSARVLAARWAPVEVRASVLGETATVVGAAGSVVRAIRDSPAAWLATAPRP